MIPKFPNFKNLELTDRDEIERYVVEYEPYSDFNFLLTWSWAREWHATVSFINNNLLFRWFHRDTQQPIYSYLGKNLVTDTCDKIFSYIAEKGETGATLSYIPEVSLAKLDFTNYYIEIDINVSDYVYDVDSIFYLAGNKYSQKRGRLNYFKLHHSGVDVKALNLKDKASQEEILDMNRIWATKKSFDEETVDVDINALKRLLGAKADNTLCVGLYDDKLIGYAIYSFHGQEFALNHFVKADIHYKGIYEFLMNASAALLRERGVKYLNYLEDLGIEGLRQAKLAYRPVYFLKKYKIRKL